MPSKRRIVNYEGLEQPFAEIAMLESRKHFERYNRLFNFSLSSIDGSSQEALKCFIANFNKKRGYQFD